MGCYSLILTIVWENYGTVLKNKVQKLQNRAASIITRSGYEIRSANILSNLKWMILKVETNYEAKSYLNLPDC